MKATYTAFRQVQISHSCCNIRRVIQIGDNGVSCTEYGLCKWLALQVSVGISERRGLNTWVKGTAKDWPCYGRHTRIEHVDVSTRPLALLLTCLHVKYVSMCFNVFQCELRPYLLCHHEVRPQLCIMSLIVKLNC